jgi:hypothetical protein
MKKLLAITTFLVALSAIPACAQSWVVGGGGVVGGGNYLLQVCPQDTVANYISTIQVCEQWPAVEIFTSYTCTSVPSSICTNLGVNGSSINMLLDPNGGHTFLIQATGAGAAKLWNVTAGQNVHITIGGKLWGATKNDTWPHFDAANGLTGQTGDGTEENRVTVYCGVNCLPDGRSGASDILCDTAHSAGIECVDQGTDVYIIPYGAQFTAAPANAPYVFTIELIMNGGTTGTATIKSMGTHLL